MCTVCPIRVRRLFLHPDVGYLDLGTGPAGAAGLYVCFLGVCREEGKGGRIGEDEAIPLGTQNPLTGFLGLAGGQGFPKFYYYEPVINNSLWDEEDVGNKLAFEMYP